MPNTFTTVDKRLGIKGKAHGGNGSVGGYPLNSTRIGWL